MKLIKITNRIFYLPHDQNNDRCVIGYILGEKHQVMVDAGASESHVKLFFTELEKHHLPKPDFCILTHWHWDHTYGLHATRTISFATQETNKRLKEMIAWTWSDADMLERIKQGKDLKFSYPFQNTEYPDKSLIKISSATVEFKDELLLDLEGVSIIIKKIDNSHSPDCCVVFVPTEKCIFLGDIIYEDLAPDTPVYYREKHNKLVNELKKFDFNIALTGHQPPMSKNELFEQLELDNTYKIIE